MKQVQENSFISYTLSDQVSCCNVKWFLNFSKITSANLCKPIHDINYFTFICPFVSGKCGKDKKKLQKFEYLKNKKSFLDEKKKHLVFEGLPFGEKIKTWLKIADTCFNITNYMFFSTSSQNFKNRLGHAYGKSLFQLKVCLHFAYSLKFC